MVAPFAHLHELPQIGQILVIKNSHMQDPAISILYRYNGITMDAGMCLKTEGELNQVFERFADQAKVRQVVELFHEELIGNITDET